MAVDLSVLTDEDKFIDLVRQVLLDRGIAANRSDIGRVYDRLCEATGLHQQGLVPLETVNVALGVLRQYAGSDGPLDSVAALYRAAEASCEGRPMALGLVRLAGLELRLPEATSLERS